MQESASPKFLARRTIVYILQGFIYQSAEIMGYSWQDHLSAEGDAQAARLGEADLSFLSGPRLQRGLFYCVDTYYIRVANM